MAGEIAGTITVNGAADTLGAPCTVAQYLTRAKIGARHIAVAVNGELVPSENFKITKINFGDRVEIVTPTSGG